MVDKVERDEPGGPEGEAEGIAQFRAFYLRDDHGPQHAADGLHGIEDAYPVACLLIGGGDHVEFAVHDGGAEGVGGHGAVGVGPHVQECCPAEELYGANSPECRGGFCQQLQHGGALFGRLGGFLAVFVVLGVGLGLPFADFHGGVQHAEDEYEGTDVEGIDDGVGHYTLFGGVLDANPGEDVGEHEAYDAAGVAQERLYGVCQFLLPLIHHVSHQHLEGLHGHVDGSVEENEHEEPENHRG